MLYLIPFSKFGRILDFQNNQVTNHATPFWRNLSDDHSSHPTEQIQIVRRLRERTCGWQRLADCRALIFFAATTAAKPTTHQPTPPPPEHRAPHTISHRTPFHADDTQHEHDDRHQRQQRGERERGQGRHGQGQDGTGADAQGRRDRECRWPRCGRRRGEGRGGGGGGARRAHVPRRPRSSRKARGGAGRRGGDGGDGAADAKARRVDGSCISSSPRTDAADAAVRTSARPRPRPPWTRPWPRRTVLVALAPRLSSWRRFRLGRCLSSASGERADASFISAAG